MRPAVGIAFGTTKGDKMGIELKKEDGKLKVYCSKCGSSIDSASERFKELASSGEFESVEITCTECSCVSTMSLKLGIRERGVV